MDTENKGFALNLVEGEHIEIISGENRKTNLSYIESILIPAATGKIQLVNKGSDPCKIIMVCIKSGIGISESLNTPQDG